jgi:hypothetical protein
MDASSGWSSASTPWATGCSQRCAALSQQTRQMIFAMIGTVLSLAALARFI